MGINSDAFRSIAVIAVVDAIIAFKGHANLCSCIILQERNAEELDHRMDSFTDT